MILKNVENKENKTATFQVESDAAEFESAVNGAYLKNKASINIPGFRKGKAPRAVVEGMYGAEVFIRTLLMSSPPRLSSSALMNQAAHGRHSVHRRCERDR